MSTDGMQFEFVPRKRTTDKTLVVWQLQEKFLAKKEALFYAFVDLETYQEKLFGGH